MLHVHCGILEYTENLFCVPKDTLNRVKRQPSGWEKICYPEKELLCKTTTKNKQPTIKNGQRP